jgi:hypothetical protein
MSTQRDRIAQLGALEPHLGRASELLVRYLQPGLLLLADLRRLHRTAAGCPGLELLGQGAQAARDTELLSLTKRCHLETLRQTRGPTRC